MSSSTQPLKITTVILIRHAEKHDETSADPSLSTQGQERAKELTHVVGKTGIKAIYTSTAKRTNETAQPLANLLNLTPKKLDDGVMIANDILANHLGEMVLVVGHTNTIPQALISLKSDSVPLIKADEFDNFFVLTIYSSIPNKAHLVSLKYGN